MNIPHHLFITTAKVKEVFYFSTNKIFTDKSHYFICIKRGLDEVLLFTCCTTQKDKREAYLTRKGYPLSTLVSIRPDVENGLTQDTYVDCNSYIQYTTDEFKSLCESKKIEFKGEISDIYYEQILIGLHASPEIEESEKELIPSPDDI